MIDLPIIDETNWAFISRGTGSTEPVFTDDGQIQCATYSFHTWKQALDTRKTYNIYFYKETQYHDMNMGVCNSNTEIPSRYPTIPINESAGAVKQSINKVTISYDTETQYWYISVNDGIQIQQLDAGTGSNRFLTIQTTATPQVNPNRILAITEQTNGGGAITDKYSIKDSEDTDKGFNTSNWTGNGTRTIQEDGTISLTHGTDQNHYYGIQLPNTDWIIHLEGEFDNTAICRIQYTNTVDGLTALVLNTDYTTKIEEREVINSSQTITKNTTVDKFITSSKQTNLLTIKREGTKIIFKYTSNDTNQTVEYTREYTELSTNGTLQIQTYNGAEVTLHALTILQRIGGGAMSNMIDLPTYNSEKWNSYTPTEAEGQTTSETTWTDEGIIKLGTRQRVVYKEPLDLENKIYTIYCYTTSVWQRIGLIKDSNTYTGANIPYKTLYSYGNTTINPEIQEYKLYVENGAIYHEWNNTKQKLYDTYIETSNYYLYFYTPTPYGADKVLAITEETIEEE